ncbi:MAG: energy transducer TonB [Myxococcota bacterium]
MSEGPQAPVWRRHAMAALVMPLGATAVLGAVVVMNELSEPPEKQKVVEGTAIEVKKAPKPKPKQAVQRPRPRPRRAPSSPPPPSLQALTSGLSGIAVDIPNLGMEDVSGAAKDLLGNQEDVVHTSDSVDDQPVPQSQAPIDYPPRLRKKNVEGYVLFSLLIDEQGNVERVKVLESKPPGAFDEVATEAIRQWTFEPGKYKGEPVKTWARQKISFKLRT